MECPRKRCKGSLRVTNSYRGGPGMISQRRACDSCNFTCPTVTLIDTSGLSARALSARALEKERSK